MGKSWWYGYWTVLAKRVSNFLCEKESSKVQQSRDVVEPGLCSNWIRTPWSTAASGLQVLVMVPALSQLVFVYFFQCVSSAVVAAPRGPSELVVGCWLLRLRFLEWPFVSHPILHMVKRNRVFDGFGFVSFLLCLVSRLKPSNGGLKSRHGWNGAEEAAQLQKKNRYVFSIV